MSEAKLEVGMLLKRPKGLKGKWKYAVVRSIADDGINAYIKADDDSNPRHQVNLLLSLVVDESAIPDPDKEPVKHLRSMVDGPAT